MSWRPPSGSEATDGCVWLPRLVCKARRVLESGSGNLIGGEYMFGDNDPVDAEVLRFLGVNGRQVLDAVRAESSDAAAAQRILTLSGKTRVECENFSRGFLRRNGIFLAMMDADEHRTPPGFRTSFLRFIYNRVVMPPAYMYFGRKERQSTTARSAQVDRG